MKALVLEEVNTLVFKDVAAPEIGPDEVLLEVKACGICGSDVHGMDGSTGRRIPPLIMGHEAAGFIAEVGQNVTRWKAGDRVTFDSTIYPRDDWYTKQGLYNLADNRKVFGVSCDDYSKEGAFAQFAAIPQHVLHRLPDNVSFDSGALTEPLAVALHAVSLKPVNARDSAVVIGTGIIGLLIIQVLKSKNLKNIIAVDRQPERLKLALEMGAEAAINSADADALDQIKNRTNGRGADIAYEAIGLQVTVSLAVDAVRKGAVIVLVGNATPTVNMPLQKIVTKQLTLQGSCAICGEYPEALRMISGGLINLSKIISARAPLSEGASWFKKLYDKEPGLLKVILNP